MNGRFFGRHVDPAFAFFRGNIISRRGNDLAHGEADCGDIGPRKVE